MRFSGQDEGSLLAAALALTACGGTTGGDDEGSGRQRRRGHLRRRRHRLLRRPDRVPTANLGINIRNGAQLAVDQHNEANADCKVDAEGVRLRRATRTRPPASPTRPSATRPSSASSGPPSPASPTPPARSSPRLACRPSPRRRPTRPCRRTAGTPSTASSATTPARARRRPTYISDMLKAPACSSSTTRPSTAPASPRSSPGTSATPSSAPTPSRPARPTSRPPSPRSATPPPSAVFFGGYYAEAGLLVQQMRGAGVRGHLRRRRTVSRTRGSSRPPVTLPRAPSSPARASRRRSSRTSSAAFEEAFDAAPATYSAEAYDAANVFLRGHPRGQHRPRVPARPGSTSTRVTASPSRSSSTRPARLPTTTCGPTSSTAARSSRTRWSRSASRFPINGLIAQGAAGSPTRADPAALLLRPEDRSGRRPPIPSRARGRSPTR